MTPMSHEESDRFHRAICDDGQIPTPTAAERVAAFEAAEAVLETLEHDLGCLHPFRPEIAASIYKAGVKTSRAGRPVPGTVVLAQSDSVTMVWDGTRWQSMNPPPPPPPGYVDRATLASDGFTPQRFGAAVQDLFTIACEEGVGIVLTYRMNGEVRTLGKACVHCDEETQAWIPKLHEAICDAVNKDADGPDDALDHPRAKTHEVH